jgi:hypothetical protein
MEKKFVICLDMSLRIVQLSKHYKIPWENPTYFSNKPQCREINQFNSKATTNSFKIFKETSKRNPFYFPAKCVSVHIRLQKK